LLLSVTVFISAIIDIVIVFIIRLRILLIVEAGDAGSICRNLNYQARRYTKENLETKGHRDPWRPWWFPGFFWLTRETEPLPSWEDFDA
jgi:hypothetical protein